MKNSTLKRVCIEIMCFLIQMLLSKINLFGYISPAGFPFALVRIYSGHNIFLVIIEYIISKIWLFGKLQNVFSVVFEIVIIGLYYFCLEYIKTKKQRLMLLIFIAVSKALMLYYSFVNLETLLFFIASFVLELVIGLYFFKFFEIYKNKFLFFKFSNLDYFLFAVMVLMLSLGLFSLKFIEQYFGIFIIAFLIMVSQRIFPIEKFYVLSSMIAIGAFWVSVDYFYLIFMIISAVCLINFKDVGKYWYALFASVLFGFFILFFKMFIFFEYFSFIFAVFCFVLLPQKWISKLQILFEQDAMQMIVMAVQENKVDAVTNKLHIMSETLSLMQHDFKMLMIGKIDRHGASVELANDVINKCCKECENYKYCFMQNINKKSMIESLLFQAIENESISANNLNNGMQAYCMKKGILLNEINQTAELYLAYENAMKSEDSSKLMIASELGNFADIFSNFAKISKNNIKINKNSSKILKEAFLNALIEVKETLILETENGINSVCVVSANENLLKREILEIIQRTTKNKMKLKEVKHLEFSGLGLATFVPIGRFRLDIAVSSKSKEIQNGDNVVVTKLSDTKYFIAIADGMGHGESANKISTMVLSLIKSMFEVGLDDELIVQSVNKLLLPAGLDNFTTLDACVIDLEKETGTFIKLGSSVSVIKHKNTSEIVMSQSLPIGVVQNINPTITKKCLSFDDTIFLASDGVVDSFSSVDEFKCFINDTKIYNLQKHLDNIIFDAGYQNKHPDDMTIIGINLLKN